MKKIWIACLAAGSLVFAAGARAENNRSPNWVDAQEFATLPQGVRNPEGITANPANGDIVVATFDARDPPSIRNNKLLRYSRSGKLVAQKDFGPAPLLGLGFRAGQVYILNFGASELQRIAANFDASTPVQSVARFPSIGPPSPRPAQNPDGSSDLITFGSNGFPAPNAMVFDAAGNVYASDSFQGAVFRIDNPDACAPACVPVVVSHDPLLATAGFPPFGANGLALDAAGTSLFIANTGDNRVLRMALATGAITVFAESMHGADGLWFSRGLLWVAANQADTVFALNDKGRYVVRAGEFEGIGSDGAPKGLLFPASLVELDGWMYVTNAALALTPAIGDEWEEDVTRWNIARFRMPR